MNGRVHVPGGEHAVYQSGERLDPGCQQILQPGTDHIEREKEYQRHDADEHGDGGIFSGQDPVQRLGAEMLPAHPGLCDTAAADLFDKGEAHVRHGGAPVQPPLLLHLGHDVGHGLLFIGVQFQGGGDALVPLNELSGGKTHGQSGPFRVILDEMDHRVETAVHSAVMVLRPAEILDGGGLLIPGNVDRMAHQLVHTGIFHRGNGHHRNAQHALHGVHIHPAAVAAELVHHVQGDHHGKTHFQQLHGEIQVPLNVGGVHNVDDGRGLFPQHKIPGHQLLAGIGGHGINTRQIGEQGVGIAPDGSVLFVHGDAGEIAHMLVGAGELVEERGFPAVLVAHQRESEQRALRQGFSGAFGVEPALLAKSGVMDGPERWRLFRRGDEFYGLNADLLRVCQTQRQFIAVDPKLHGISHGRQLDQGDLRAGDHAHIQKMLPESALSPHGEDPGAAAGGQFTKRHTCFLPHKIFS